MKKLALLSISAVLVLTLFAGVPAYAADDIAIFVHGEELVTDVPPMIINDRTMIPLRAVTEAVGCRVEWFADDQRVEVYLPIEGEPMIMHINDPEVILNLYSGKTGETSTRIETIDAPPVVVNNRTLVPLRFIAETIGFAVEWDDDTRTVYLDGALYEDNGSEGISLIVSNWPVEWDGAIDDAINGDITYKMSNVDGIVGLFIYKITGSSRVDSVNGHDAWINGIKTLVADIEGIAASSVSCVPDEALSAKYTYPIYRLLYTTGSGIDTDTNIALYYPIDPCDFLVQIQIDAQSADLYSTAVEDWFNHLTLTFE